MVVARGGVGVGVVDAVLCLLCCVCVRVRDSTRQAECDFWDSLNVVSLSAAADFPALFSALE